MVVVVMGFMDLVAMVVAVGYGDIGVLWLWLEVEVVVSSGDGL